MKNKIITLAVLKEARIDENRTPFSPIQISNVLNKYSNVKIIVQPSKRRCFKDEDYLRAGAKIKDDLSSADIIFGVKEVDISTLIKDSGKNPFDYKILDSFTDNEKYLMMSEGRPKTMQWLTLYPKKK